MKTEIVMDDIHCMLLIGILCVVLCLGAIYWAHIDKIYYGNDKEDAKAVDFDDSFIYDELALPRGERRLPVEVLLDNEAIKAFEMWKNKSDKIEY